jgi:Holliday junction resolvase RusA-like endonuclease
MKVITPRGRKPIMIEDHAHSEPWRKRISAAIRTQCPGVVFPGPVSVIATFSFERLGPSAQALSWPVTNAGANASGDLDKLTRNLLDAMEDSGLIVNDCMVVGLDVSKCWTVASAGVHVEVTDA